ncbi:hypothetical protein [Pyxidicoccus sp. MSG2]|uniref:hypothetical protein n=1 Tax=Pyxidicoccus sp. MSG2 TaxID=2996790 RepID=UPI00226FED43|nr:hypothetical protein [Pyxidicoccus sp. MSG2]MCY1015424.1 hypothetical protein [Pyxidicoccus sp. MSG2]
MSDGKGQQGPSSPEDPGRNPEDPEINGQGEALSQKLWEEVRGGVEHFHLQGRPRPKGPLRQFFYGMSLPFHLARALLKDPVARRTYLRVGLLQTVAALALALTCMGSGKEAAKSASRQETREEAEAQTEAGRKVAAEIADRYLQEADAKVARRILEGSKASRQRNRDGASRREDAEESASQRNDARAAAAHPDAEDDAGSPASSNRNAAAAPPSGADATEKDSQDAEDSPARQAAASDAPDAGGQRPRTREERRAAAEKRLEQRARELEAAAQGRDAGTSIVEAIAALAFEAARTAQTEEDEATSSGDSDEDGDEEVADTRQAGLETGDGGTAVATQGSPPAKGEGSSRGRFRVKVGGEDSWWTVKGFSPWDLAFWAALFATLHLAQWVVIALSRDYHDVIARDASLLTGVKPEDEKIEPRVRLDMQWLRKKVRRRWRAALLFAVGVPALWVLTVPFLCFSTTVFTLLNTAWGAWWLVVFTAAKSEHAWVPPAEARTPWFLRAWTWLTTRVPGMRWGMLQRYGAFWTRRTQEVLAPVSTVERHPWAFAGLALVRFVGSIPPLKFFCRPLIPVASAHLLAEEAAARAAAIPPAPRPQIPAGETGA